MSTTVPARMARETVLGLLERVVEDHGKLLAREPLHPLASDPVKYFRSRKCGVEVFPHTIDRSDIRQACLVVYLDDYDVGVVAPPFGVPLSDLGIETLLTFFSNECSEVPEQISHLTIATHAHVSRSSGPWCVARPGRINATLDEWGSGR